MADTPATQQTGNSTHEEIAIRAYCFWQERGCPIGSPEEDWYHAEEELRAEKTETELRGWFASQVAYEGIGRAEFTGPQGSAEGPTKITFDELGDHCMEMFVEKLECDAEMELGPLQFFSGQAAVKSGANLVVRSGAFSNPCSKLTVKCANGTFLAESKILYDSQFRFGDQAGRQVRLRFHPLKSQFDEAATTAPKFWVLPLYNFLSRFLDGHQGLEQHPLRIIPAHPKMPSQLSDKGISDARAEYAADSGLIVFEFHGNLGFIQPLPDYEARAAKLTNGNTKKAVTAVMVAEVASEKIDFHDLEDWFPFEVLGLLGLATGTVVGAPWMEFRNSGGQLVRRSHVSLGVPIFAQGHGLIDESLHHSTGRLITKALASANFGEGYIHAAVRHLVLAGSYSQSTLEDELTHLARALDCACHELGLTGFNLLDKLTNPLDKKFVKDEIKGVAERVEALADAAMQRGESESEKAAAVLRKIANKTRSEPPYIINNFGEAVVSLLKRMELEDWEVVERYYAEHPREDGKSWQTLLSNFRGTAVHQSYFDFGEKHDVWEVWAIIKHLHDILVRVVLKSLDYDGMYHPIVSEWVTAVPLNWVKKDTPPARLGYSG